MIGRGFEIGVGINHLRPFAAELEADPLDRRRGDRPDDPPETFGNALAGRLMVMLDRRDYWQCAYIIRKGADAELRQRPIDDFRTAVRDMSPFLGDRVGGIRSWDDVKLLTVKVDRLATWHRPHFLAIGDAAHAMSPIGGVGINLAIQDAVAAANILAEPLRRGAVPEAVLAEVQKRREFPTRVTQGLQIAIQKRLIDPLLHSGTPVRAPWIIKALTAVPWFRTIPAYLVGIGVRPEHVKR